MKAPYTLACLALVGLSTIGSAQNLIDGGTFYSPAFSIRQQGATSGALNVIASNVPQSSSSGGWTHAAGGLIQTRVDLQVAAINVLGVDAQLFATTRTTGNSLVFGRGLTADTEVLAAPTVLALLGVDDDDLDALATGVVNGLVSANAVYNWSSDRTVAANIVAGQTYRVSFDVSTAPGLPASVISSLNFGIENDEILGASSENAELLNLLGLITLGGGGQPFQFDFVSSSNLSSLDFNFAASSVVGANLLGGAAAQDYLTFSNMSVVAVPEPGVTTLAGVFAVGMLVRRKRR